MPVCEFISLINLVDIHGLGVCGFLYSFQSFIIFWCSFVVVILCKVNAYSKRWIWSTNWDDPKNWDNQVVPCSKDEIQLSEVAIVKIWFCISQIWLHISIIQCFLYDKKEIYCCCSWPSFIMNLCMCVNFLKLFMDKYHHFSGCLVCA